jgi:hypothetical protein
VRGGLGCAVAAAGNELAVGQVVEGGLGAGAADAGGFGDGARAGADGVVLIYGCCRGQNEQDAELCVAELRGEMGHDLNGSS